MNPVAGRRAAAATVANVARPRRRSRPEDGRPLAAGFGAVLVLDGIAVVRVRVCGWIDRPPPPSLFFRGATNQKGNVNIACVHPS